MKGTVYELCEIKGKYSAVKVDNAEIHKRDGYAIYNAGVLHRYYKATDIASGLLIDARPRKKDLISNLKSIIQEVKKAKEENLPRPGQKGMTYTECVELLAKLVEEGNIDEDN